MTNPATKPEKRRPQEWAATDGLYILDADGWRSSEAPAFDEPITRAEFDRRIVGCTIGPLSVARSFEADPS